MRNDSFYKTLRIVCLILAIVCMALSLFKKAKADTIPNYMQDIYSVYIDECTNISNELKQDVKNYINTFEYSFVGEFYNNGSLYERIIYLTNYEDMGFCSWYGWNGYGNTYFNGTRCSNSRWNDGGVTLPNNVGKSSATFSAIVILYNNSSSISLYCNKFTPNDIEQKSSYGLYLYYNHSYSRAINNIPYYSDYSTPYNYASQNNQSNVKCLLYAGADDFKYFYSSEYDRFSGITALKNLSNIEYFEAPPSTNTDGFEVYKYGSSGAERLVCDFSSCISISQAVGNSSTIQINIIIDGVDHTFNFDSTSSYYDYSVPSSRAVYSFPLTVFGINSNTISAKLTGVNILNTTSSPGGSSTKNIVWVTPLTLVGSDYENLVPEVIPDAPDYTLNINNQQYYEDIENKITSEWVEDVTQSDVHNYVDGNTLICAYQRGYTWTDWWNDWSGFFANVQDLPTYIFDNSPSSTDEFKTKMMDFLKNNYGSLYFDTVIITWDPRNGELPLIYVWKTNLYQLKNTNSILKDMAEDLNISAFYIKQTYFDIKGRLDDFEDKSLTKLNELVGLQELENGFISSLQSILNQILNALLNLNIDFPEADYSSITSRLDQIISNQGSSNLNGDWYQNYREWLYGINENDSYLSPHEYFNNIFGSLKTTYDSFTKNLSFNAYILKVEDFLNHISGNTSDNLTIYLRDGIGDPGFNINNNYMYTVGGS